jgi:uncharacterized protein YciI
LDTYTFVLLRRGPRADDYSDGKLDELQAAHLAFLAEIRERGHLVLAGPFRDQDDETKRGLTIYRTSLEETRQLTEQDPSVQAGRISIEAMTWLTPKGVLP